MAGQIAVGTIAWNETFPGNAGEFDIVNDTGVNSSTFPDPTFPVSTTLTFSNLSLLVDFNDSSSQTYGPSYFTLSGDGQSFDGTSIPIGGTNPLPVDATLTGTFAPTSITLNDGSTPTILSGFTATFSDSPNLMDGDFAVIYATTSEGGAPEPGTWLLLATGLALVLISRKRATLTAVNNMTKSVVVKAMLPVLCVVIAQAASGPLVKLNTWTSPSTGVSGVTNVNVSGTGFPTVGTITASNVAVKMYDSCGGTLKASAVGNSVTTILGSSKKVNFSIPPGVPTGNYFVTLTDTFGTDADFSSINCSEVSVTGSAAILNACVAGSSIGVLLPPGGAAGNVTAYVPKGSWDYGNSDVFVKNIEGVIGASVTVPTANGTNSCSANPATGKVVCVANNTDVYLITGTTLTNTLTSGSNATASFSGGNCNNCGVAINGNNNTAVINMGLAGPSNTGVQILNLNTNTFNAPFPMLQHVTENISVDPTRSLVLSANEGGNYVLDQIQPNGSLKEFDSTFSVSSSGGEPDSSAEDCSTGIAITPNEFTNDIVLVNLNNITFGATTYTAPNSVFTLSTPGYGGFSAGVSGSAVAQGSGHLAAVTGEFGGNTFAVLQLPAAPGPGVPFVVDYAVSAIPSNAACGGTFSAGYDPHTMTAYTSPNNGHSMAVFAGYSGSLPICLAVVDMTVVINPGLSIRGGGGYGPNEVSPANLPVAAVQFFPL